MAAASAKTKRKHWSYCEECHVTGPDVEEMGCCLTCREENVAFPEGENASQVAYWNAREAERDARNAYKEKEQEIEDMKKELDDLDLDHEVACRKVVKAEEKWVWSSEKPKKKAKVASSKKK